MDLATASSFLALCCCWVNSAVPSAVSWSRGTMEMEGGGTVRLSGGAEMGSTVLVGMVRLNDTDLGGSTEGGRRGGGSEM